MADPAHGVLVCIVEVVIIAPSNGVRISSDPTNRVTFHAVRGGALVVTRGATVDVQSGLDTVEIRVAWIEPTSRVKTDGIGGSGCQQRYGMTVFAKIGLVTVATGAGVGCGASLKRMSR